jgi:hypothetical protein
MGSAQRRKQKAQQRPSEKGGQPPPGEMQAHPLDMFDTLLAQHRPFADSDYLHEHLHAVYQHRLGQLSAILPGAGELERALEETSDEDRYRIIGDPVIRHTIHQALRNPEPLAEYEDVFRETIRILKEGKRVGPLESGAGNVRRLGTEPGQGWVWTEEHTDDVFGRSFRKIVSDNFRGQPLCTPRPADLALLAKGVALLRVLLPHCSRSVLSHTHLLVLVPHVGTWMKKGSCSEFQISGTIFINRKMLHNPWWVAEHLLHESLHQKLYDFRHTHSFLVGDLSPEAADTARVCSIWNVGGSARSNYWDTFRAVAAFHVYVHQAVLCLQADRRMPELLGRFGPPDGSFPAMTNRREAFERAQYLGRRIRESCWAELGPAGRFLVDWLISILNAIDLTPPPPESSYIHLLLNRYMTEAVMIADKRLSPESTGRVLGLISDETETIRRVVLAINGEGPDLGRLQDASVRRPDEGAEAEFLRFRNVVASILQRLSVDGYGLRRPPSPDSIALEKMIQTMVESSSQQLVSVLEGQAPIGAT